MHDVSDWAPIYDHTGIDGDCMAIGTSGSQFENAPVMVELPHRAGASV